LKGRWQGFRGSIFGNLIRMEDLPVRLDRALAPGDRLVWSGRPSAGPNTPLTYLLRVGVALWLGAFGVSLMEQPTVWAYALAMAIAFLAVLGLEAWARQRTVYGLTRDSVIVRHGFRTRVIDLRNTQQLSLELGRDDTGTIRLGQQILMYNVRHARTVYELARQAQRGELE
jgi:hypothetical protein